MVFSLDINEHACSATLRTAKANDVSCPLAMNERMTKGGETENRYPAMWCDATSSLLCRNASSGRSTCWCSTRRTSLRTRQSKCLFLGMGGYS